MYLLIATFTKLKLIISSLDMSKQMRHVKGKTNRYVTFLSWSQFVLAMHYNSKGTHYEDSHKIMMDEVKPSGASDVIIL